MLTSSTVTRILTVTDAFAPALAEAITSEQERLPVFDASTLIDVQLAQASQTLVYLTLAVSVETNRDYIRGVQRIDPNEVTRPCLFCRSGTMTRVEPSALNGNVAQFVCDNCPRRLYLAPVQPSALPTLPLYARARLNRVTDAIFILDHQKREAFFVDACPCEVTHTPPWAGAAAEILPPEDYQESQLAGLSLRWRDHTHGRAIYPII